MAQSLAITLYSRVAHIAVWAATERIWGQISKRSRPLLQACTELYLVDKKELPDSGIWPCILSPVPLQIPPSRRGSMRTFFLIPTLLLACDTSDFSKGG